jgi:hypothetical protein
MSRFFDGTTSGHLDVASATVSAYPMSMCAWVKMAALGVTGNAMNCGTSASSDNRFSLLVDATAAPSATTRDTVQTNAFAATKIQNLTGWHLISGTWSSTTLRTSYLNGGSAGTDVNTRTPSASNAMAIGTTTLPSVGFNGYIAHVGLWDIALSAADHAALFLGMPNTVQPDNLREYWPLVAGLSPEPSFGLNPHSMIVTSTAATGIYSDDNPLPGYTPPLRPQNWS